MSFGQLGRGLNDLVVDPIVAGEFEAMVDVPGARSLQWATTSDSDRIEGDDIVLGVAYNAKTGSGTMTTAKASLTALAAMLGLTATAEGTTPNQTVTLAEGSAANQQHIQIRGQALSVDTEGSAFEVILHDCVVGGISETLELNAWHIPEISFEFLENADGDFITRKLMETRVALADLSTP